jgi:hypothetical protein
VIFGRFTTFLIGAFALTGAVAFADPAVTTVGVTLNPAIAVHESYNDKVHVPPIPVPLIEVSHRFGPFEIAAIGLPPTVAVPYTDAIQSRTALRISILDATLRVFARGGRFGVGAGETLYNQTTHYAVADFYPYAGERQYSRVVGGHYELLGHLPYRAGFVEASVRYAPAMLGTQVSTYDGSPALSRFDPERGRQIDASVRYIHHIDARREAILGLRYVNFTAAYDVPLKPLSDRNAGLLPTFGYRWKIGR